MQVEATEVISRYRDELASMTERALLAEAMVRTLQQDAQSKQIEGE